MKKNVFFPLIKEYAILNVLNVVEYVYLFSKGSISFQIVDATPDKCDQAFAYLPDIQDNALIVYSFADNDSWRVKHNYFSMEPFEGDLNIANVNFQWHDGIFALALGPMDNDGYWLSNHFIIFAVFKQSLPRGGFSLRQTKHVHRGARIQRGTRAKDKE